MRLALVILALAACGKHASSSSGSGGSGAPPDPQVEIDAAPATASSLPPAAPYSGAAIDASAWTPHVLPAPAKLDPDAAFGHALDLDGDTLVVGAPGQLFSDAPGAVYVYQRKGAGWDKPIALTPPADRKRFGNAVAISGDTIVAAVATGDVLVYDRKGGKWTGPQAIALPEQDPAHPWFSFALALDHDTLAVGLDDWAVAGAQQQGVVLVYQRTADAWTKTAEITAPDVDARRKVDDQAGFGRKVSLRGDRLVVGSGQGKCKGGADVCGAARVFERSGGAWKPVLELPSGELQPWAHLGVSLAQDDQRVVIGALGESRAWVVERTADGWRDAGTLGDLVPNRVNGMMPAEAVAIRGALAARGDVVRADIGTPPTLPGTNELDTDALGKARGAEAGHVLVFTRAPDGWTLATTLTSPHAAAGDEFGAALALGDGVLYVGAPSAGGGEVVAFTK